jgi:tetratricopeptide (TPR) repeat protein
MAEWAKAVTEDQKASAGTDAAPARPYWRYRYGKLLLDMGNAASALGYLTAAVLAAEKIDPRPTWLAPIEFLAAEAMRKAGKKADAVEHYRRFLDLAPNDSPDRADAQKALATLGGR